MGSLQVLSMRKPSLPASASSMSTLTQSFSAQLTVSTKRRSKSSALISLTRALTKMMLILKLSTKSR